MTRRILPDRGLTNAEKQARYRAKHPDRIAAKRAIFKRRGDAKYRDVNHAKVKARQAAWEKENEARNKILKKAYYKKNEATFVAKAYAWAKANPEKIAAQRNYQCSLRRARLLNATPAWANSFFIREIYDLSRRRNKLLSGGVKWQVDHIVPLKSNLVCGLHVEHNLRIIPAVENRKKNNKHWPQMPVQIGV